MIRRFELVIIHYTVRTALMTRDTRDNGPTMDVFGSTWIVVLLSIVCVLGYIYLFMYSVTSQPCIDDSVDTLKEHWWSSSLKLAGTK